MIALGGTIGVGLFMGSSARSDGPGRLSCWLMRSQVSLSFYHACDGRNALCRAEYRVVATFGHKYIHPLAGYMTAWSNWFQWVIVGMSEIIAVGSYMKYWFPDLPAWIPGIIAMAILGAANLISVKSFGEFEFWFAMIKIVTIILMIVAGIGIIFFGFGNGGHAIGLSNLWSHGGFFTNGFQDFLCFVFGCCGLSRGRADRDYGRRSEGPAKNAAKRFKYYWRILISTSVRFSSSLPYIRGMSFTPLGSPFVSTFAKVGITAAAGLINFVVITAAMSGCNSGIFSAGRMLYTLGVNGQAPNSLRSFFERCADIRYACGINRTCDRCRAELHRASESFVYVYSASVLPGMIPWFVILISHLGFRRARALSLISIRLRCLLRRLQTI